MPGRSYGGSPSQLASRTIEVTLQQGGKYIADTATHTGNWRAITALEAAVAALTVSDDQSDMGGFIQGTLSAVPIPAGCTIYGSFTSIDLASGKVLAYNK